MLAASSSSSGVSVALLPASSSRVDSARLAILEALRLVEAAGMRCRSLDLGVSFTGPVARARAELLDALRKGC